MRGTYIACWTLVLGSWFCNASSLSCDSVLVCWAVHDIIQVESIWSELVHQELSWSDQREVVHYGMQAESIWSELVYQEWSWSDQREIVHYGMQAESIWSELVYQEWSWNDQREVVHYWTLILNAAWVYLDQIRYDEDNVDVVCGNTHLDPLWSLIIAYPW